MFYIKNIMLVIIVSLLVNRAGAPKLHFNKSGR